MPSLPRTEQLTPLIETLAATTDPVLRDRILVEAAAACTGARAAAVWRPRGAVDGAAVWTRVAVRGDEDRLPTPETIEAVRLGHADDPPQPGQYVLAYDSERHPFAVVLGDANADERDLDLLEAMIALIGEVEEADPISGPARAPEPHAPLPDRSPCAETAPSRPAERRLLHDLRNLLGSITATRALVIHFGHTLGETEHREVESALQRDCRRVGCLIVDALADATASTGGACFDPTEVVRDVVASQRHVFAHRGARLALERLDPVGPLLAPSATETGLRRVLQNLLQNSLEAHDSSDRSGARTTTIEWMREDRGCPGVLLAVQDDGPGLPPGHELDVFTEGVTIGKPSGTGLGLAVVRDFAVAAGGQVDARNVPGGGARLSVWIPLATP